MKYFLKSTTFKIFLGIFFIVSGAILYTLASPNDNFVHNILSTAVYPAQTFCKYIKKYSSDFSHQFEEKEKLKNENIPSNF